jgi:predicted nuclease of predicted toxin-antitoxin system
MKFIVDAQLPKSLADFLIYKGFDALHTLDLPAKNKSQDHQIIELALSQNRVVITKDGDFLDSYLIKQQPEKLILVRTGNITNKNLIKIFSNNLDLIISLITQSNLVEINKSEIIDHL